MNNVTSLIASATSDERMINTIDQVAGKGASWWLAGIALVLLVALGVLFRWMVTQNRDLMADLKATNSAQMTTMSKVVTDNTVAMTQVAAALAQTSTRLDNLEDKVVALRATKT